MLVNIQSRNYWERGKVPLILFKELEFVSETIHSNYPFNYVSLLKMLWWRIDCGCLSLSNLNLQCPILTTRNCKNKKYSLFMVRTKWNLIHVIQWTQKLRWRRRNTFEKELWKKSTKYEFNSNRKWICAGSIFHF